jgi:hypothetical protein
MPFMVTDGEVEQLMEEAFRPLPVPSWWVAVETTECLTVWTVVEHDALRPARLRAMASLREMLAELAEVSCTIHSFEKQPTKKQAARSVARLASRW